MAELNPDIAKKYKLAPDTAVHAYFPGFGELNLATLPVEAADQLVAGGFKYLIPLEPKAEKPTKKP